MPNESLHSPDPQPRTPRRRGRSKSARTQRKTQDVEAARPPEPTPALAEFALLADPATIAGDAAGGHAARDEEIERLRSALAVRDRELASLQASPTTPPSAPEPAVPDASSLATPATGPSAELLGAEQARRLAAEAHDRERASREALALAQRDFSDAKPASTRSPAPARPTAAESGWEQRPLQRTPQGSAASEHPGDTPLRPGHGMAEPEASEAALPALRAQVRELEATLALARNTSVGQKAEIARLRASIEARADASSTTRDPELDEVERVWASEAAEPSPSIAHAPAATACATSSTPTHAESLERLRSELDRDRHELARLRERLALAEREAATLDADRGLLRATLEARESDLTASALHIERLESALAERDATLAETRERWERAQSRNAETQALLDQLRQTLGLTTGAPTHLGGPGLATRPADPIACTLAEDARETLSAGAMRATQAFAPSPVVPVLDGPPPSAPRTSLQTTAPEDAFARTALFAAWQDDQVRRHFGPLGIDSTIDLLNAPMARRKSFGDAESPILLLGRGAAEWAVRLADGLLQNSAPAFRIHVADPEPNRAVTTSGEHPVRDFLSAARSPESPAALRELLAEIRPCVLILRDFLSAQSDVHGWLEVVQALPASGPAVLFLEATGLGPIEPPAEIAELGDRIWGLIPERYTAPVGEPERPVRSWREAFSNWARIPANGLRDALRTSLDLEIFAQFGFLAEPFLCPEIGAHFDPEASRDRRFLRQIADLDDRKIEAGLVPPLHLVALFDRLAEP